jgi:hypothetical protein
VKCAEQVTPGKRFVCLPRVRHRPVPVLPHDRIQRGVVAIDPLKHQIREFARRDFLRAYGVGCF